MAEKFDEQLGTQQQLALSLAEAGRNVFITGAAGTGESVVLKCIRNNLKEKYAGDTEAWANAGPTGVVACAIEGQTIHSLAGCGVPIVITDFEKMWGSEEKKWRALKVLLLDEVSMTSGEFLDLLYTTVDHIRHYPDTSGEAFEFS